MHLGKHDNSVQLRWCHGYVKLTVGSRIGRQPFSGGGETRQHTILSMQYVLSESSTTSFKCRSSKSGAVRKLLHQAWMNLDGLKIFHPAAIDSVYYMALRLHQTLPKGFTAQPVMGIEPRPLECWTLYYIDWDIADSANRVFFKILV